MRKNFIAGFILLTSIALLSFQYKTGEQSLSSEPETGINIGNKAPELVFNNPDGNPVKLSSLKGKMVLIDFWAAWCPPCRRENPNLVRAYDQFKNKAFKNGEGFTVYSVSLDRNKKSWVDAIKADGLKWEYHVSDLKYWNSEGAALYHVRAIPSNFLIDGDGIIVARNLRGPYLTNTLQSLEK